MDDKEIDLLDVTYSDPATDAMRSLFELFVFYVLLAAIAFAAAYFLESVLQALLPDIERRRSLVAGLSAVGFLVTLIVINRSFDSWEGGKRKRQLQTMARRYGYPITLAVGVFAGWQVHDYSLRNSEAAQQQRAAYMACSQMPMCVRIASRLNMGNDVSGDLTRP